jgi:PTH1 family peptidyl-tRNA hydrolase
MTRHNAGAMLVDALASKLGVGLKRVRGQARAATATLEGRQMLLGIPTTYMNESGRAVAGLVRRARAKPDELVVCHDELDIPLGRIRLKAGGGTAGHRGLDSICAALRSKDFLRMRIGIGRPQDGSDATDKVLSKFHPDEKPVIEQAIARAMEGLSILATEGLDAAQRFLHAT